VLVVRVVGLPNTQFTLIENIATFGSSVGGCWSSTRWARGQMFNVSGLRVRPAAGYLFHSYGKNTTTLDAMGGCWSPTRWKRGCCLCHPYQTPCSQPPLDRRENLRCTAMLDPS
jgi:hypothetical protein